MTRASLLRTLVLRAAVEPLTLADVVALLDCSEAFAAGLLVAGVDAGVLRQRGGVWVAAMVATVGEA